MISLHAGNLERVTGLEPPASWLVKELIGCAIIGHMVNRYGLYVDSVPVARLALRVITQEMRALFTDSMLRRSETTMEDYGYSAGDPNSPKDAIVDGIVKVYELVAPSQVIADRLEVLGVDRASALAAIDRQLEEVRDHYSLYDELDEYHREVLARIDGYTALDWVRELKTAPRDPDDYKQWRDRNHNWILEPEELFDFPKDNRSIQLYDEDRRDLRNRLALRAVLVALTDAEVRLDISHLVHRGELDKPETYCSEGLAAVRAEAGAHAPIIVLTEGRTDIETLEPALGLLYPHLADLIRFMDYAERPEGGAGALVRTVRAFAASGVANRVVALFDNDTAATDALKKLDINQLPTNIRVLRFPPLEIAVDYPTLGPPTADTPTGRLARADVNGLAGSIELYLGHDVLTGPDGTLQPVQWRSYIKGARQYQGEIIDKDAVHEAYRAKVKEAQMDTRQMAGQDWSGVRAILELVRTAFA